MTLADDIKTDKQQQRDDEVFKEARRRHVKPKDHPSWPFSQAATFPIGDYYQPHQ